MNNTMRGFQEMRLEAYKKVSLKQPLSSCQLKEFKSLAKELYGIEV